MRSKEHNLRYVVIISAILLVAVGAGILMLVKMASDTGSIFQVNGPRAYVAVIGKSNTSAFWESVSSGARASAAEYNLDMTFEAPDNEEDFEAQNEMIRSAIAKGADAIVFSAIDYNGNADAINEAIEAGIPVVIIDSDVNSDGVSCRIMTDNYAAGQMAGMQAIEDVEGELVVGVVNYDVNSANGQQREQGFCDAISSSGRVRSVYTINCLSTQESAYEGTVSLIGEHPDINMLAALNELMSLGSGYAVRDMGLQDEVSIYAFDSNVVCVGMLETGEIDGLIVQNPYAMGYLGVENAYKLINGLPIDSERIDTTTTYVSSSNMYDIDIQRMIFMFGE
ncbi:MAG: substrate-binding domain-containing protein [Clostridiales bacterium]|nr:substrate-binding domain-containing protein [Clostridiales bacterium]